MRIAQVAPLWETIPPRSYGGTELVVHLLAEELVKQGHDVTLFASGTSKTSARLVPCCDFPLRDLAFQFKDLNITTNGNNDTIHPVYPGEPISLYYELKMWEQVFAQADRFDIIHNHLGFFTLPFANLIDTPVITTLHGEFKAKTFQQFVEQKFLSEYAHLPFVSISNDQRKPFPILNYVSTIYHGLDLSQYKPSYSYADKTYLAFLGRFCYDKGAHHAVRIAKETGWNLIMAGKVDNAEERVFFEQEIKPHLDDNQIRYIGEVNHPQKVKLLRHAAATLCPVNWREPFGLVLIESMACGTPVLALRNGSIPEIVAHGKTGFVTDTADELIDLMPRIGEIDRRQCRQHVAKHFSMQQMAANYVKIYEKLIENSQKRCYPTWEERQTKTSLTGNVSILSSKGRIHVQ
jgi:glycosyltransferase involved in cell wall biosynthesis